MKWVVILLILVPSLAFGQIGTPDRNEIPLKTYNFVICQSNAPISDPNHNLIPCNLAREIKIKSNLFELYQNGYKLIQILESGGKYFYYLEKR